MSTRSQLRFVQPIEAETEDGDVSTERRIAQVYRHSDGYPESVLRDLSQLKQLLEETRSERGPDFAAAQLLFLEKLGSMDFYLDRDPDRSIRADKPADLLDPANMEHLDQPLFLLGHGVENPANGIHGDEEYLYVIEMPTTDPLEAPVEWTVQVSTHCGFPRWDGPTGEAFDRASWQFEGPLSAAVNELLAELP